MAERPVLIMDRSSSICGNCGKECDPNEYTHTKIVDNNFENKKSGCGVRWKYLTTNSRTIEDLIVKIRPDLELIRQGVDNLKA